MRLSSLAIDAKLAEIAGKANGLICSSDLVALQIPRSRASDRELAGLLTRVQPNVWLFGQLEPTFEQCCRAAVWSCDGLLAAESALAWHGIFREPPQDFQPSVIIGKGRPTLLNCRVIRSTTLTRSDRTSLRGLATTSIPRSLLDAAAVLPLPQLERILDDALITKRTTIQQIESRLDLANGGRNTRNLRALVNERRQGRMLTRSKAEQGVKAMLAEFSGPKPILQFQIRTAQGRKFELDLAWPEFRVAIEIDGFRWHGGRSDWKRDLERDRLLALEGWNVRRVPADISPYDLAMLIYSLIGR